MKFLILFTLLSPIHAQLIPEKYLPLVFHACAETGVPLYIADGVIREESNWDPLCQNKFAGGLMQLGFKYHAEFRDKYNGGQEFSEFDPEASVRIGLRYLAHLHDWLGTWRRALYFYNCGYSANVKKSVRRYADRILEGK